MSIPALSRLVLVPAAARSDVTPAAAAPFRRYRLARVENPGRNGRDRFAHLKRAYD